MAYSHFFSSPCLRRMAYVGSALSLLMYISPSVADPDIQALFNEYKQMAVQEQNSTSSSTATEQSADTNSQASYNSMLGTSPLTQSTKAEIKALTLDQYFNKFKAIAVKQNHNESAATDTATAKDTSTASVLLAPSDQNKIQDINLLPELLQKFESYITEDGLAYAPVRSMFPGRIMNSKEAMDKMLKASQEGAPGETNFYYPWLYRNQTYELHFANPQQLASCIYSLAIFTKDISTNVPYDKFIRGVSGFHYSVEQICDWINHINNGSQIRENELAFIALLRHDGVISFDENSKQYQAKGKVAHILGASASKKRSILTNLRHERLHVYWDLDSAFQERYVEQAKNMSPEEQKQAFKHLINYNQENIAQLIEEWAIGQAEQQPLKQKSQS